MYDLIIIGAGILGATLARKLSRYELNILVLERAYDIGEGATKANSAVLSAGYHARGGSLKGICAVQGNEAYKQICQELQVDISYPGSLHCAYSEEGLDELKKKKKRGIENGAKGLKIISGDEAREMEPHLSDRVVGALYAPSTGIIDIFTLLVRTAQDAAVNGVQFEFNSTVDKVEYDGNKYIVSVGNQHFEAPFLVNTAGENAAEIEAFIRRQELKIRPKRGQFLVFDRCEGEKINHVLYQQSETDEKGCLLAPSTDGKIVAGPTSENVKDYNRTETTEWGINHIIKVSKKIIPDIDENKVIAAFAGVRANITNIDKEQKDFVIRLSNRGMVSALGIKNPGMTGAPYLTDEMVRLLCEDGLKLKLKPCVNILNIAPKFFDADSATQNEMVAFDPSYGHVICRCELVTEGDIRRVLNEPLPPGSMNGLKKRLRLGMGRCQGGFCTPRVINLLADAWNIPPEQIVKSVKGSNLVKGRVRK